MLDEEASLMSGLFSFCSVAWILVRLIESLSILTLFLDISLVTIYSITSSKPIDSLTLHSKYRIPRLVANSCARCDDTLRFFSRSSLLPTRTIAASETDSVIASALYKKSEEYQQIKPIHDKKHEKEYMKCLYNTLMKH